MLNIIDLNSRAELVTLNTLESDFSNMMGISGQGNLNLLKIKMPKFNMQIPIWNRLTLAE